MSEDIVSAVFPDDTDPDDLSAEVAELRSALDQAVAKIEALEADMHNQTDVANRAVNDLRAEIDGKADSELFVPTESVIPDLDIDIDGANDKDWAHPDSQFTVPTSNSIEQEYSTDGSKSDMLKLYQFKAPTFAPIACTDLDTSTPDHVLVRKLVDGVPTLVYTPVVEMTIMSVSYTDSTNKVLTLTPRKVKILCNEAGSGSESTLTFTQKTLVASVAPDSATEPTKLESTTVTGFILSAVDVAEKVPIIAIEGCD